MNAAVERRGRHAGLLSGRDAGQKESRGWQRRGRTRAGEGREFNKSEARPGGYNERAGIISPLARPSAPRSGFVERKEGSQGLPDSYENCIRAPTGWQARRLHGCDFMARMGQNRSENSRQKMMHCASAMSPAGTLADQHNLNHASGVRLPASPIAWLISLTLPRNEPRVHGRQSERGKGEGGGGKWGRWRCALWPRSPPRCHGGGMLDTVTACAQCPVKLGGLD